MNVTLIREIRILQELSLYNHPNIVKVRFVNSISRLVDRGVSPRWGLVPGGALLPFLHPAVLDGECNPVQRGANQVHCVFGGKSAAVPKEVPHHSRSCARDSNSRIGREAGESACFSPEHDLSHGLWFGYRLRRQHIVQREAELHFDRVGNAMLHRP